MSHLPLIALAAGLLAAAPRSQNQNDLPANNGGEVVYLYSSPSVGGLAGDLYWRAAGPNVLNDFDAAYLAVAGSGAIMEIDGYVEAIYDSDWSTPPLLYDRHHGPAVVNGLGGLEPDFLTTGVLSGTTVSLGSSGFGHPCTIAPSLCSPPGGLCPPPGFLVGWQYTVSLTAGTAGTGILVQADGTAASAIATTWFVPPGMISSGGPCGLGDYAVNDFHSVDEIAGDVTGNGINPDGGFQIAGVGGNEALTSMSALYETWHGNVIQGRGGSFGAGGVGGALDGRYLSVGSGTAALAVSLIDRNGLTPATIAVAGASLGGLPSPGVPVLGGRLLVLPSALFQSTSAAWQAVGAVGAFDSSSLTVPASAAGVTLHVQGASFDLASFTADTTNAARVALLP